MSRLPLPTRARPAPLELFKFTFYVFFPIATMLHFGDPDFYDKHVVPFKNRFLQTDKVQMEPPQTPSELKEQLAKLREERLMKKAERETGAATGSSAKLA